MASKAAEASLGRVAEAHAAIACLTRLAELLERRRGQLAAEAGITEQQWSVLEEIASERFMPSLFARHRDSSPAAVSKILRQLAEKGLIVTAIAEGDARQRRYSLTARGKRVMQRLDESRKDAVERVWLALDAEGMRAFTDFGQRLVDKLERYAAGPKPAKRQETEE